MSKTLRIVIVGAGGIGGITAALLQRAKQDVTLVCKHPQTAVLASTRGLHVTGVRGDFTVPTPAVATVDQLNGFFDLALIATKAYDMPASAQMLLPYLKPDSLVLSLQNGICTDALAAVVGAERTVGCVVGFGATMLAPAELEMTSTGAFIIGRITGDQAALLPVKDALSHVVETAISEDIYDALYSKLIVNSCITSLGAICGLRLGEMLRRKQARNVFLAIITEAMAVARAMALAVPAYGGKLDYDRLLKGDGLPDRLRRHVTILLVGLKYRNLKSSSLQSLERGRPTEIDYFNGYIVQKGDAVGVDCPLNRRLTVMIKEIERGERAITPENLYDPALLP